MRLTARVAFVAALLTLPALAGAATVRTKAFDLSPEQSVRLDFPQGELHVEPSTDGKVHVSVTLRCTSQRMDCEERARKIDLVAISRTNELHVKLDGWPPSWNPLGLKIETRVKTPAARPLDVEMGVGNVDLRGHRADVDVRVGVGDASIAIAKAEPRHVRLESGVGRATLRRGAETIGGTGVVGHVVDWDQGKGRSEMRVKVGVGRIDVRLD